jgi:hypothetical protein
MPTRQIAPVADRLDRLSIRTLEGHLLYQGHLNVSGYGTLTVFDGTRWRTRSAHRVAYETWVGPIGDGLVVDHICKVKNCIEPNHLRACPQKLNVRGTSYNAAKTHCKAGHAFTEDNTYVFKLPPQSPGGIGRSCRACHVIRQHEYLARKAEREMLVMAA